MKTLQIEEKHAWEMYATASPELKKILEDSLGKEFFAQKITDRIKTYEDACVFFGVAPNALPDVNSCLAEDRRSIIAYYKLTIITRALNEGWRPNWDNDNERKWYPYFLMSPGSFACGGTSDWRSYSDAGAGSRLCLKSEALAVYAGKQFSDLYKELMLID